MKGLLNGLEDKGGRFLTGGTDLHQKGVEEFHPFSLFCPQRHQDKGKQQKEDDKKGKTMFTKEEKTTYPHQTQYWTVTV